MDITQTTALLGGLAPAQFMRRYWQKAPLLIRGAIPAFRAPLSRAALFALVARDDVESRLLRRAGEGWALRHGPFARRALPRLCDPDWTLLVQGVDLHDDAARDLLERFRFIPDTRLDDVMVSYATAGGGVGPHFDSYDVFLLQAHGRRRWRIGHQRDLRLKTGLPLKILARFEPEHDWVLEPGDMLYLPPQWAHDGVAVDECMTYSIGFRAPAPNRLASELLYRYAEQIAECTDTALYRDPQQAAVAAPGAVPDALVQFARRALMDATVNSDWVPQTLGAWLTEPKSNVWFGPVSPVATGTLERVGVALDRCTRMLYHGDHLFVNGEVYPMAACDRQALQRLADERGLEATEVDTLGRAAKAWLDEWRNAGWLHVRSGS